MFPEAKLPGFQGPTMSNNCNRRQLVTRRNVFSSLALMAFYQTLGWGP